MKRMISLLLAIVLVLTLLPGMPIRAEAKTGSKLVALTFDDGPSSKLTTQLLDGLKERGVPVTFFILGENAKVNRSIVRRAYEEGHEIACHSWDHPDLSRSTVEEIERQIENTFEELDRACGDEADYLVRPPYGNANAKAREAIDAPLVNWSVDSEDWSLRNTTKVRQKIVADVYDGSIILCHDIHKTTIPAALGAIDDLMDMGYEFVTVSELFRRRGRELEDHKIHYNSNRNGIDYGPIPAPQISFTADPKGVNTVTITCSDKDVPLYYTLDGSYPNQDAQRYTGPFTVPYGTTVTAVAAWKLNGSRSALTVKTADKIQIAAPTITLDSSGDVVMTTPTVDSEIYFTIDNTKPTANSLRYEGPESIAGGCFLRAVTVHSKGTSAETTAYLSEEGNLYYDMYDGQWFYDAMDWAYQSGILNGTAAYTMNPSGTVTRGMLVTLLYRFSGDALGAGWERTNGFQDVNQSFYYAEAIEWAYRNQIVDGYGPSAFGPDDVVTRQQMCKIVAAFLTWKGTPLRRGESCQGQFADYDQLAPWALESVEAMVSAGLIVGDGVNINPNNGTNRAQFCVVLTRLVEYIENYVPEEELPDHDHVWKLNYAKSGSYTWCAETIREGDSLELLILCEVCGEIAPVEWIAEPDGVVLVEENTVTGILGGNSALLYTVWEDVEYQCLVYVRENEEEPTEPSEPTEPTEPEPTEPEPTEPEPTEPEPTEPEPTEPEPTEPEPTEPEPTEPEPTEPEPTEPEPTEPEPTEPEPTEPEHVHDWKLNKSSPGSETEGDVSINVGESFTLRILCRHKDCTESAPITWTPSREGVVKIDGFRITGVKAGSNTTLSAEWEGETYSCIIRVRKQSNSASILMPFA